MYPALNRNKPLFWGVLLLCFGLSGPVTACPDVASAEELLSPLHALYAADEAGDLEAVMSSYSSNPVLLPPAGTPIEGRDKVRASYVSLFANASLKITPELQEWHACDDMGFVRGVNRVGLFSKKTGFVTTRVDQFLAILLRQDGNWLVHRLMWSEANPQSR